MTNSSIHQKIEAVVSGERLLDDAELEAILVHVAKVGFDPVALERVRGRLAGIEWNGVTLKGSDLLPSAIVHYLWHVTQRREWPEATTLNGYIESLREIVRDPSSGVVVFKYQGATQLGVFRESGTMRGPVGQDWVLIQYRLSIGHWVTAFQPVRCLQITNDPQWTDVQWLRQPTHSNMP